MSWTRSHLLKQYAVSSLPLFEAEIQQPWKNSEPMNISDLTPY